jgi:secreted PhoX family phosphatase
MMFDADGHVVRSFGKGLLAWPHGFFIDAERNIWVTEGAPMGDHRGEAGFAMGLGHQVFKFSHEGELLMTLGEAGVAGDDASHFNGPSGIAIARNGDIWITDGHRGGNNRVVRFDRDGNFIAAFGGGVDDAGDAPGQFNDPHGIAIDSEGRIFVADRGNNRIQILDPEGNYLDQWRHFGRPSGLYIDENDVLYSGDGMSDERRNPGYRKGIYIGSAATGEVWEFIPDDLEYGANESGVEFLAPDSDGNIYAGEVTRQRLVKYVRSEPRQ